MQRKKRLTKKIKLNGKETRGIIIDKELTRSDNNRWYRFKVKYAVKHDGDDAYYYNINTTNLSSKCLNIIGNDNNSINLENILIESGKKYNETYTKNELNLLINDIIIYKQ